MGATTSMAWRPNPELAPSHHTYADKRPWEMVFGDVPLVKKRDHIITPIDRLVALYNDGKLIEESWEGWTYGKENARMYATERIIQQMPDFAFSDADASALLVQLRSFTDERLLPPISVRHRDECRRCVWPGMGLFESITVGAAIIWPDKGEPSHQTSPMKGAKCAAIGYSASSSSRTRFVPSCKPGCQPFPSRNKRRSMCVITS